MSGHLLQFWHFQQHSTLLFTVFARAMQPTEFFLHVASYIIIGSMMATTFKLFQNLQ